MNPRACIKTHGERTMRDALSDTYACDALDMRSLVQPTEALDCPGTG